MSKEYSTIGEVMKALVEGKKLRHSSWNDKNSYIHLSDKGEIVGNLGSVIGITWLNSTLEEYCPCCTASELEIDDEFNFIDKTGKVRPIKFTCLSKTSKYITYAHIQEDKTSFVVYAAVLSEKIVKL